MRRTPLILLLLAGVCLIPASALAYDYGARVVVQSGTYAGQTGTVYVPAPASAPGDRDVVLLDGQSSLRTFPQSNLAPVGSPTPTPTPSPTPTPTASPTPTPTLTPTPTATATPTPEPGTEQFPSEATTGTPPFWTPVTVRSSDMTVSTPGTVVQDVRFTNGAKLNINAANVTVRRVELQGGWIDTDQPGVVIEDSTLDRLAPETNGGEGVISYCGYTARRVKILDRNEGFRESGCPASQPTTIEDSFARITPPANCTDWHGDGIQGYYGTNLHVTNVTIDFHETSSCGGTAPFFYNGGPGGSPNGHAYVNGLLLKGGGFSFRLGTPAPNSVQGLRIVDGSWRYAPIDVYTSDGGGCAAISPWEAKIVTVDADWAATPVRDLPCRNS